MTAADSESAWAQIPEADVVVTGIQIPGSFDGVELVRRVHQREPMKPVIVLTAWCDQPNRQRAELAGCDVFLSKPCPPDTLIAEIRGLIERSRELRLESVAHRARALKAREESDRLHRKFADLKRLIED